MLLFLSFSSPRKTVEGEKNIFRAILGMTHSDKNLSQTSPPKKKPRLFFFAGILGMTVLFSKKKGT